MGFTILSVPGLCLREPDFKLSCDMAVLLGVPLKNNKSTKPEGKKATHKKLKKGTLNLVPYSRFLAGSL